MWIFVAAVVVVAIGALVVAALMRPGGDDVSVRSYHSALGTLEHLSQPERRVRRPTGRGEPTGGGPPHEPAVKSMPPAPVHASGEIPDPSESMVFDDARPKDRPVASPTASVLPKARRAQQIALDSMNRRPRRGVGVVLVVVALVAFAVLAYVGSRRSHSPTHAGAAATTHARSVTSTTAHPSTTRHSSRSRTSTTTTAPSQIVSSTVSSTGSAATYPVANAPFTLQIAASGPVWVDVTTTASGATLWTGTLQAGGSQSVQATGATAVELGATGAALTVDGTPVVLPTTVHTPFVATFQPATSASAPTAGPTTGSAG
jgi:hypothetical protein